MSSERLKAAATGQVAVSPIAQFSSFLAKLKPQMALALPKHMNADRMTRLALTAFSSNNDLQQCSAQSIASSIMTAAQLGLEPGIGGQGYLIPYKGTCTFVPGWKGLVDLVARSGRATVWTGVVFDGDEFEYQLGDAPFCRHVPGDGGDSEQFTHVYAIGRVRDASMAVIEVWTRAKVQKHLKQYNKVGGRHYALASENNFEMYARKVALLQVLKYMPASIELANAIEVSHATESGNAATIDGDFVTVQEITPPPSGHGEPLTPPPPHDQGAAAADPETGEVAAPPPPAAPAPAKGRAKAAAAPPKDPSAPSPLEKPLADLLADLEKCTDADQASLVLDAARHLIEPEYGQLVEAYRAKFGD